MNRIVGRTWVLWLLITVLVGGIGFFGYEYVTRSSQWVLHSGSPHVYQGGGQMLSLGKVTDRNGNFLLDLNDQRKYATDPLVRMATLHWLGDRTGNIRATALQTYADRMAGFSLVNGLYGYGGGGGVAQLTISAPVQVAALAALEDYKGTIAVLNYQTGEILCAVSTPTFDPDDMPDLSQEGFTGVYWNRFLQAAYVPGSIFKIFTTAMALEQDPAVVQRTFTCTGRLQLQGGSVTCERAHGQQDLQMAMKNSCNCYYGDLTLALGRETLLKYADCFGLLKSVTFDGITTASGKLDVKQAAQVELAWAGIGQHTDLVNPCGFLCFVAAVANGGQHVQPYVVKQITASGQTTYATQSNVGGRILSTQTATVLQAMLRNNVVNGYGEDSFPEGMSVCAKSGTGEVDGSQKPYAMFAGFVTEEAYPLAFIAAVEDAGYGKQVCMPMISQVLAACKTVMDEQ